MVGVRVVTGAVPNKMTRFEHRAPGSDVNPYLSIASLIFGSLKGLREGQEPPALATGDLTIDRGDWAPLPNSMPEAIEAFRASADANFAFGEAFVRHWAYLKSEEWREFSEAVASPEESAKRAPVTQWEYDRYFIYA